MGRLSEGFFSEGSTEDIARRLIGMKLVSNAGGSRTAGLIVETEAYLRDDPACHASKGRTKRNESMFLAAGHSYVYLVYGMHHCFNVVTAPSGIGEAVLVRAVEPIEGIEAMSMRRGCKKINRLADGPGKLCRAMGIDKNLDGQPLWESALLYVEHGEQITGVIASSARVGISSGKDLMLRFFIKESPFVSRL